MSEIIRRGRRPEEEERLRAMQAQQPQLQVPQREDAELDGLMARSNQMVQETEPRLPASAVRTAEEEEAYNQGAKMGAAALAGTVPAEQQYGRTKITKEDLIEAERLLMEYKAGKASVDRRIINAQEWWKLHNWPQIQNERGTQGATQAKSATAWLWNCIVGKHAEAMDSFPEPIVLPRMQEDKPQAEILSEILPVVLQMNGFEEEYSKAQWQKFQEGTGAYHVGWDASKLGGMGDISIKNISLLNLFWEPGVEDIQDGENLFYVQIVDTRRLEQRYPHLKGKLKNAYLKPVEYRRDDQVKVDGKSVLVDWYYHTWYGPKKVLHYCQFVNREIIYSTENKGPDENGVVHGLYDDSEYPFVLDPLYPVHGSPAGYGLIDIGRDAQTDIDILNQAMVLNAVVTSTPRWFVQQDGGINESEYAEWSNPFVHFTGSLNENNFRQIITNGIQGNALSMLERKIEELKFITGNTDVNNGSTPAGVTAASAIAALQEYSGRGSKDSTRSSYRADRKIYMMTLERVRQLYDIPRQFRILGPNGQEKYVQYSNAQLREQQLQGGLGLPEGYRRPIFDIDVRTQRETAYTKISTNELAIQLRQLGVFDPQTVDQSLMMLDMMDFKRKEEVMDKIREQGTLRDALLKVGQIALMLAQKEKDPVIAQQLGMVLQQIGMDAGGTAGGGPVQMQGMHQPPDAIVNAPSDESAGVRNARARAQQASQPA